MSANLTGSLSGTGTLGGSLSGAGTLSGTLTGARSGSQYYRGPYEFTPSEDTQTVEIESLTARHNITINPIPDNYGRIAWNGYKLRVY